MIKHLSEECCDEQYSERLEGKGKILKGFFRYKNERNHRTIYKPD